METNKQSGLGIASLILGIIGIMTVCIAIGIVPCVIGLIISIIAFTEKRKKKEIAIVGMVFNLIGILLFAFMMLCVTGNDEVKTEGNDDSTVESSLQASDEPTEVSLEPESEEETTVEANVIQDEGQVIEQTTATEMEQNAEETEQEYKDSCEEYRYKDVLRNPKEYVGKRIKITAKIYSVHEESWSNDGKYYFVFTNDKYDMWLGDKYAIYDRREAQDPKLLSEDVITIWGEISDPEKTTSLIVSSEELFVIDMKYAELISE